MQNAALKNINIYKAFLNMPIFLYFIYLLKISAFKFYLYCYF